MSSICYCINRGDNYHTSGDPGCISDCGSDCERDHAPCSRKRWLDRRIVAEPAAVRAIRKAADPMAIIAWQEQHGLSVASVSRYVLNMLDEVTE